MPITFEAIYEDGVLKPSQPLPLAEHEKVQVTVEERAAKAKPLEESAKPPIWEEILALTRELPPEAFDTLPVDGASQHDHYIYGTPKRTDLSE